MDYADNNRISHRQLYRQMVLAFLAPTLLCLPGRGQILGAAGIIGTMLAGVFLILYSFFLRRLVPWYSDPVKMLGPIAGRLTGLFFLSYVILANGYLLSLTGKLVPSVLVTGIPGTVIIFFTVFICSFGTCKGMQRRGRMAEVSGGVLLGGILLMLLLCMGQIRIAYLKEMPVLFSGQDTLKSFYGVLCAFSGIALLPFMLRDVEKRSTVGKTVVVGILTLAGLLAGILFLLPAVLGWDRLQQESYPVLPLLAGADLPGNVLARFDVLWMGFLLYSLLFAVGSLFHYGHQILIRSHMGKGRWWLPAAVFAAAVINTDGKGIEAVFGSYLGYVFVPGLILIQGGMLLNRKKKRQKKVIGCLCVAFLLFLSGCAAIEPEKRMYPLALGVNTSEEGFSLIYGTPDLPKATGQEKEEEEKESSVLSVTGRDFVQIREKYDQSQEKYLDMSHIQVILMGNQLVESGRWTEFLTYLDQDPFVGENVYVFQTENPSAVLAWDSGGTSIGEYLTGLLENRLPDQQKKGMTLRQVYHQWYKNGTLPALPAILLENEEIRVYLE
ncbi:MAG: GerAB/ArcD/ProY family transporter [Blautia sp.]|uniref:GerAB/ArcD/ProY family transporter n=1 Tax=Blautia sp. TaxID=1955243 RepID=UPI002A75C111|nr:GerAB/ArcD/ProY family transporter [Blautia sp.]MDY3017761.1 GerAB/ArcD/ProY family transporter [Blautia sp.]